MYLHGEMKSECNITPSSESMSTAMSLILIYENMQPSLVDNLDALIDSGSSHAMGTPT